MNLELTQKLYNKYPKIFEGRKLPLSQNLMCFGIDTGDGWYWLIDQLCKELQLLTDKYKKPQVVAFQIKEKYGSLRFYTTGEVSVSQQDIINFAERLSCSICAICGSTEEVKRTKKSWISFFCKNCMEKMEKKDVSQ